MYFHVHYLIFAGQSHLYWKFFGFVPFVLYNKRWLPCAQHDLYPRETGHGERQQQNFSGWREFLKTNIYKIFPQMFSLLRLDLVLTGHYTHALIMATCTTSKLLFRGWKIIFLTKCIPPHLYVNKALYSTVGECLNVQLSQCYSCKLNNYWILIQNDLDFLLLLFEGGRELKNQRKVI